MSIAFKRSKTGDVKSRGFCCCLLKKSPPRNAYSFDIHLLKEVLPYMGEHFEEVTKKEIL